MFNFFKKTIFNSYCSYYEKVPIEKGKYRTAQLLESLGYAVYNLDGILLELNPVSLIDRKLISGKSHDPIVCEHLLSCLKNGGTFLDIGANIGYFSLLAAKMPNVKVFAFEPSPRELNRFYRNISLNSFSNITVFPYGLSNTAGVVSLNLGGSYNPGINSVLDLNIENEKVNCQFTTLDSLMSKVIVSDIRFCKIDVEGFEMSVLQGMEKSMPFINKAVFIVEISPNTLEKAGHQASDIYNFFEKYGYISKFGRLTGQYDELFYKS